MNKLKFSLLIVFFGMISLVGAQTPSFSVKGGLNMSNFYGDDASKLKMKLGFNIGVGAELDIAPNIAIQTGLIFTTKGAKVDYEDEGGGGVITTGTRAGGSGDVINTVTTRAGSSGGDVTASINAYYLQLPVHIAYKIDVMPGTKVVLHAGPYVAYGIGGKRKYGTEERNTFDKEYGLKPLDIGAGLGVGAEFGKIIVDLGWDMGLINVFEDDNIKNQNAYVSLGYKF